ncbi:MAG: esterase-like activity of phytase family protein [Rhodospirillum sp.]|nr:esterase-like activity of phytase family protein [Rhodospirillum sp.]MCF8490366.1 esterase-like activity of phytase family protein [Rhodospirillum sp.]MCF8501686.1 esterase-like activity of phytase family protein [Rhodospirillum sp.]
MMRSALIALALFPLALTPARAGDAQILGEFILPNDTAFDGVPVGGLSELERDPETGHYLALSDDQAEKGPARFYTLSIDADGTGIQGVRILSMTEIKHPDGGSYKAKDVDPEAMRLLPDGTLAWAHERDAMGKPYAGLMAKDGTQIRAFHTPERYDHPRKNLSYESVAISLDGKQVILGVENALEGDGPVADVSTGTLVRLLTLDAATAEPVTERAYPVDKVILRPKPADGFRTCGLVALLAHPNGGYLSLERAFSAGMGNMVRLYRATDESATDTLAIDGLEGKDITPLRKGLLLELKNGSPLERIDNLEGMAWGPEVDGAPTVILVSDNNFSEKQITQFLLVKLPK